MSWAMICHSKIESPALPISLSQAAAIIYSNVK